VVLQPHSGDMEELQEIVTRLQSVTPGCEVGTMLVILNSQRYTDTKFAVTFLTEQLLFH